MPRKDIDYSKCVIYKIVCNDLNINELYIGSTTEFIKRKYTHKHNTNNDNSKDFKVYEFIRNNGGWDNWSMFEIEKFPCRDGQEARARERYWCEQTNSTLNSRVPIKTFKPPKEKKKQECLINVFIQNITKIVKFTVLMKYLNKMKTIID